MGDALLFGGGSSAGGIRQKKITKEAYLNLSESDRNNPYIVWIITNADATDFTNVYGSEIVVKALCWEAYCNLADEDRLDVGTVWIISDKTPDELAALSVDTSSGSKFYNIAGVPSSTEWSLDSSSNDFRPNTYFEIGREGLDVKLKALAAYKGVMRPYPHPRSNEALEGLAAYRGAQAGCRYAEAFESVLRRVI